MNMDYVKFQLAKPIWAVDREREMNCELAFRVALPKEKIILRLAASTIYRIWVNGIFVAFGPARAAHGIYRVDEIELENFLNQKENMAVIEVVGFNINSYDTLDQPSFLTAEFTSRDKVIAYTGDTKIQVYDLKQRIQKIQRYSFQRAFAECYDYRSRIEGFYENVEISHEREPIEIQPEKRYINREVRYPEYEKISVDSLVKTGRVNFEYVCENSIRDRAVLNIGDTLKGFKMNELEVSLSDEGQNMQFVSYEKGMELEEAEDEYWLYSFPYNATGFFRINVDCKQKCMLYVMFDEILSEGDVDFLRLTNCNCFKYYLEAGSHHIMSFAPYTMKYIKIVVKGKCVLNSIDMIEYKHPSVKYQVNLPADEKISKIYFAALETFKANAVDVFSDCPSRERAGWLCDSFFTARVEHVLTGETVLEKVFLENFLQIPQFQYLPKGIFPMCYPADHNDGNYIPNWAMWFVLELEEYVKRSNDYAILGKAKEPIYNMLKYFKGFENEYGLLENLDKWIFVEWSRANDEDVVQDVNYPTNMIYAKMLQSIAELYNDNDLMQDAIRLKKVIRMRSLNGIFYTDNEVRKGKDLFNPKNCTEVCQYYAFFTGIANKKDDKELWDILVEEFGVQRKMNGKYADVAFANAFIGNYLRIELLYVDGQYDRVIQNIKDYFYNMAVQTGTLWEHDSTYASCNHGFASHIIYWLAGIYGKK